LIALATAAGAPAAVANAINDAIGVLGAKVTAIPATPQRILQALEKIDKV
jgi:carbon-monoxide dehydrogenase large subunit